MSPFGERVLKVLKEIDRRTGRPARTVAVAVQVGIPERTMRWHLAKLEALGLICRPRGAKSGWALA